MSLSWWIDRHRAWVLAVREGKTTVGLVVWIFEASPQEAIAPPAEFDEYLKALPEQDFV